MKKKIIKFFTPFLLVILICGCDSKSSIDMRKYKTDNFKSISCDRKTATEDDSKVTIKFKIYYNDKGNIEVLYRHNVIKSGDTKVLNTYKEAYNKMYEAYKDLEYYDNEIIEDNDTLTVNTYINYGKIDMKKLMNIEGEDDNVKVTNGKIKLEDWKEFAKKYGTVCD